MKTNTLAVKRILAMMLSVALMLTTMPVTALTAYTQEGGACAHVCGDGTCGYVEGADCTHECGEDCADGCIHTEHDGECGYIEAVSCDHQHNADCGGLSGQQKPEGETGNVIASFATPAQTATVPLGTSYGDLPLPETVSATVEGETGPADVHVTWTDDDGYDGDTPGDYVFTGALGAGYILADGMNPPSFTMTVKADAAVSAVLIKGFTLYPYSNPDDPYTHYIVAEPGTAAGDLPLPMTLKATAEIDGVEKDYTVAVDKWDCAEIIVYDKETWEEKRESGEYDPDTPGVYVFAPVLVLAENETLAQGVTPPTVEVVVPMNMAPAPLSNSAGIISQITTYNGNHGGTGSLTATASEGGRVVTVTGMVTGATRELSLGIDAGVTVRWQADVSGSGSDPFYRLVIVSGDGRFEMTAGNISNTYTKGFGIVCNGGNVTISGGAVSSSETAVHVYNGGTLVVSAGNLTATNDNAIYVDAGSSITVSGGNISGARIGIDVNGGVLTVTGGSVAGNNNAGIWAHKGGTVNIGGSADIRSSQGRSLLIEVSSTAHISGGVITGSEVQTQPVVTIYESSKLYMTGGTINTTGQSNSALSVASDSRAYISGGTLRNTSSTNAVISVSNNSVVSVTGGTVDGPIAFNFNNSAGTYAAAGYLSSANITGNAASASNNRSIIVKADAGTPLATALDGTLTGLTAYSGAAVSAKWKLNGEGLLDIAAEIPSFATVTIPMGLVPSASASSISIIGQPAAETNVTEGAITEALNVAATVSPGGAPQYQWYQSHTNSAIGGSPVSGATNAVFTIPTGLTAGTYYYYCRVSAGAGAAPVNSQVAVVRVAAPAVINTTLVSAVANGQANSITSTLIRLTFSDPIYVLTTEHILFVSSQNLTPGEVTGSGTEWAVRIDGYFGANGIITVTVQPPSCNVADNGKTVSIYFGAGINTTPTLNSAAANGASGTITSSVITLQFSVNVYGLEKEDITITGSNGYATVTGLSGSGQTWYVSIGDVSEGNIILNVRSTGNSTISGATKTVAVYRGEASAGVHSVVITVNKDGTPWTAHGKTITLRQGENAPIPAEGAAVLSASAPNGVYAVWADGKDTGVSVTVNDGPASVALNYYTIAFEILHRGQNADRSTVYVSYNGEPLHLVKGSGGGTMQNLLVSATEGSHTPLVVLGGGTLTVRCVGAGTGKTFIYQWDKTAIGHPNTESVYTITVNAAVNGKCSIYGIFTGDYISNIVVKTPPQLEYFEGDTLDLSALVLEVTRGGATTDVAYGSFGTNGILVSYEGGAAAAHGDILTAAHNGKAIELTYYTDQYENTAVTITTDALIVKSDVSGSIVFTPGSKTYTGAELDCAPATVSGVSVGVWTYTYEAVGGGAALSNGKPLTAGTYKVTATYTATDGWGTTAGIFTVDKKALTITGVSAANKVYDGTIGAAITGSPVLSDHYDSGNLTIDTDGASAAFEDKNAGSNKTVTFSGYVLGGTAAGNYTLLSQPASVEADITAESLTDITFTANNKEYDGNATATVTQPVIGTTNGVIGSDTVGVNISAAAFDSPAVADGKTVSITTWSLTGADAGNYSLPATKPTTTANITVKSVTIIGLGAANKVYDGNTTATVTGTATVSGKLTGDTVTVNAGSAAFNTANVGAGKTVTFSGYSLGGADAANYTLSAQPASTTADITAKSVTIIGLGAANKTYDGTVGATITGTAELSDNYDGANLTINATGASAVFADKNAGTGKTVTFTGYTLDGSAAGNYELSAQPASVTANISAKAVTITPDILSKIYGQPDPVLTYTPSPTLVVGDGFTGALSRAESENVGTYNITLGTLSAGGNYALSLASGTFNLAITQATVQNISTNVSDVTMTAYEARTATDAGGVITLANLPPEVTVITNGGTATLPIVWTTSDSYDAKSATYNVTGTLTGNTNIANGGKTSSVTVTVTAVTALVPTFSDTLMVKGTNTSAATSDLDAGVLPTGGTVTVAGEQIAYAINWNGGETLDLTSVGNEETFTGVASYPGAPSWLTLPVGAVVSRKVTVTDKTLVTITVPGITSKTYTGAEYAHGAATASDSRVTVSDLVWAWVSTDSGGYNETTPPTHAGDYKVTISVDANHATCYGSVDYTFTINKAVLTITADDKAVKAGEALPTVTIRYNGFVGSDDETNAFSTDPVAAYSVTDINTPGSFAIDFSTQAVLVKDNYNVTHIPGTLTVSPKSSACDVLGVISPSGAAIIGNTITATIGNGATSVTVNVNVSADAAWALYSDSACASQITGAWTLAVGANTAYIKVTAEDGTEQLYTIIVTRSPISTYTVSVSASPSNGGTVSGGGSFTSGSSHTVTATANSNYRLTNWTEDGTVVSTSASYTFTVSGDRSLVANFSYTGSGNNDNGGGGGSSGSGGSSYTPTTPVTTEKQPNMPTVAKVSVTGTIKDKVMTTNIITEKMAKDAIAEAEAAAKSAGKTMDGIAVQFNVTGSGDYVSLTATFERTALEALKTAGVTHVQIGSDIIDLALDTKTITGILAQTTGNITVTATQQTNLSDTAKALIGNRPVFDITIKDGNGVTVSDLKGGTATIGIPYKPNSTEKTGSLFGVYVDGSGNPTLLINSSYDNGRVIFGRNSLSVYGVGYKSPAPAFPDTTNHWAKDNIDFVASRDLISGTSATTFSPDTAITCADFLMALCRLSGADVSGYTTSSFTDVANTNPAMPYIEWAVQNKIVQGIGNNKFGPDRLIIRQDMAVIMVNYAKATGYALPVSRQAVTFADDAKISAYAKDAVKAIQQTGVMSSKQNNLFDPQGNTTRAEASTILRRFVELVIDEGTARGWVQNDSGQWQYINTNGKAVTGLLDTEGNKYWFDDNGVMAAGKWIQISGKWYYFGTDGKLAASGITSPRTGN